MHGHSRRLYLLLVLCLMAPIVQAGDAYVGTRGGVLLTSPGSYSDLAALGLIAGYQFPGCCWAAEAELYASSTGGIWQGQGIALNAVHRMRRIGGDGLIFSPKFKIGAVHTSYTLSGNTQTNTDINLGAGILIGDANDIFEFEISGSLTKLGGSDEVMFFSINYINPL